MTKKNGTSGKAAAQQITDVILLLDKSGSMASCSRQAIDGFNEQCDEIRKNASLPGVGDVFVTLIAFNAESKIVMNRQSLDNLHKLTEQDYVPGGSTAWLNAVDLGIETMRALPDYDVPTHAFLMQSITDGEENHSHLVPPQATWESVAQKVKECESTGRWTFSVIGANIDLSEVSQRMGVPTGNTISYTATPKGTQVMNDVAASASANYFQSRSAGLTSSQDYLSSVTGGASHVDDVQGTQAPQPPFHPTNPPQPVQPRTPRNQSRSGHEGTMKGGSVSGAKSPLLGQQ